MSDKKEKINLQPYSIFLKAQDNLDYDLIDDNDFEDSDQMKSSDDDQIQTQDDYGLLQSQEYLNSTKRIN